MAFDASGDRFAVVGAEGGALLRTERPTLAAQVARACALLAASAEADLPAACP